VNPYVYVVFILLLPIKIKPWLVLVISCLTGMVMDSFSSTPGLHMAACVCMGYMRGFYLRFATGKDDQESNIIPNLSNEGWVWFSIYTFILVFIHHFHAFFLRNLRPESVFWNTLLQILFSTLFSVFIIVIGQLLFYKFSPSKGKI
jgi:magnesium-transporting ATPase (P-type)